MPRLFTGLRIPSDLAIRLSFLKGGLRNARWIDDESFHITLRFIGDVEGPVADDVVEALARIRRPRFDVQVDGLGSFGNRKPHSIWARVAPDPHLLDLQAEHERVLQRAGLEPEGRRYTPHITLGRTRGSSPGDVADWLAMHGDFGPATIPVAEFVLFSARASTGGGPYVVEEIYELADGDQVRD